MLQIKLVIHYINWERCTVERCIVYCGNLAKKFRIVKF